MAITFDVGAFLVGDFFCNVTSSIKKTFDISNNKKKFACE